MCCLGVVVWSMIIVEKMKDFERTIRVVYVLNYRYEVMIVVVKTCYDEDLEVL